MNHIGRWAIFLLVFPGAAHAQFLGGMPGSRFGPHPHHHQVPLASVYFAPFAPLSSYYSPYLTGYPGLGAVVLPPVVVDTQLPPPAANAPPARRMPGELAGRFRPVLPADRARARQPVRPEMAPLPRPVPPDPKAEHATLVRDGRGAFAAGEYGRAAELFRSAVAADPEPVDADFLLGQTLIALGKYAEAAAVIFRGLPRQPDWPTSGPALRDLYGGHPERLAEHRRVLEEAAASDQSDVTIAFLQAYVRWFDGNRNAAREQFRKLRDQVTGPEVIDRFLGP